MSGGEVIHPMQSDREVDHRFVIKRNGYRFVGRLVCYGAHPVSGLSGWSYYFGDDLDTAFGSVVHC